MPVGNLSYSVSHCSNRCGDSTFHATQFSATERSLGQTDAMSIATLNDIFFTALERNLDRMLLYREAGKWLPISSREFGQRVACISHTLRSWAIQPGDRVAILSENRPEWPMADMATLLIGGVTVPLYTTLTPEQTAFVLNDSGCRVIFLSSDQQLHKLLSILRQPLCNPRSHWTRRP
jgi:long-chain acyl-CoA synthetase